MCRFFSTTNQSSVPNYQTLDAYIKLYPKMLLLADNYSMISMKLLESINKALIKSTQYPTDMGGIRVIFFSDIAQQLPVNKNKGTIWESENFSSVNRYHLRQLVRQQDLNFITILNKVRICNFDESAVRLTDERTVHKFDLLLQYLRLYTTRELAHKANEKDHEEFLDKTYVMHAHGNYIGTKGIASVALKKNRLAQTLHLKIGMSIMSTSLMVG